jgi:acyl carrier protein
MSENGNGSLETQVREVLWQSLRGGDYDLSEVEAQLGADATFEDLGIDSLDQTDFFIRVEDRFKVKILQEDYASLNSLRRVQAFLEREAAAPEAAP